MDLVEFLTARLDEDERWARAAINELSHRDCPEGNPRWEPGEDKVMTDDGQIVVTGTFEYLDEAVAEHIARHDPARVLADVAAKRQVITSCVEVIGGRDLSRYGEFGALRDDPEAMAVTLAVETLRALALPDADHPDYRSEWAA